MSDLTARARIAANCIERSVLPPLSDASAIRALADALDAERARADAAEADRDRADQVRGMAEDALDTVEVAYERITAERDALRARAERLEAAIRQAPHAIICDSHRQDPLTDARPDYGCTCWKSAALTEGDD